MKNWKKSPIVKALLAGNVMLIFIFLCGFSSENPPITSLSLAKMNIFYIGVENPITVSVENTPSDNVTVTTGGSINIKSKGNGKYTVTASQLGNASLTVSAPNLPERKFNYRVRRIPDPVVLLGKHYSGIMKAGLFKAQKGLIVEIPNFDFDAKCEIVSYEVTRVSKNEDPVMVKNVGAKYSTKTNALIQKAKPGDVYYFEKVKAKCLGDYSGRTINSLVFRIE